MSLRQTADPAARKKALREEAALRRREAARAAPHAGAQVRDTLLASLDIAAGSVVSGYWPMGSELDVRPTLRALAARGHPICLPVVVRRGEPLLFRAWREGDTLVPAGFGTQVPAETAPELVPRVLLVPLLAFDREGYRLGYGGGFYDRTLAKLRTPGPVLAIGLGYAAQEMAELPHEAFDQRLDCLVTEREAIACELESETRS